MKALDDLNEELEIEIVDFKDLHVHTGCHR